MSTYSMCLPCYTVGEEAYQAIPEFCHNFGSKAVVIGGNTAMSKAKEALLAGVKASGIQITDFIWFGGDATYTNINKLKADTLVQAADMLFAVGGGRACDTVKTLAALMDKPLFTFPTLASNCASSTAICVLYNDDATFREYFYRSGPALHTFINTRIIAESPDNLFWAGIGDALSKEYEVEFATRKQDLFHTPLLGATLAHACAQPLLTYGEQALADCKAHRVSFALEQVALDIIISTGLVSNFTSGGDKYYYNSNLAHCVYCGATLVPACGEHHLHGEVVAFGILCLLVCDGNTKLLEQVANFNLRLGLPVTLAEIDLKTSDVKVIADKAVSLADWKAVYRPVTKEEFSSAILEADRYGRQLKNRRPDTGLGC